MTVRVIRLFWLIRKNIWNIYIKSFSWRRLFIQSPIVGVYLGHYLFKLIFSLHARIITILCTINPFFLIILFDKRLNCSILGYYFDIYATSTSNNPIDTFGTPPFSSEELCLIISNNSYILLFVFNTYLQSMP